MIVRIDKEQQAVVRRQLLSDIVWVISNDTLRKWQHEGKTTLAPVEVFMTAQCFCDVISGLSDIDEGIDYEIDDLEDEVAGENDAMLIAVLAALQMQALSKRRVGQDFRKAIIHIFERYGDHELFIPLVEQWAMKEERRWMDGKKNDLLNYELKEITLEGGGVEEIKHLFENMVDYSDKMDEDSIKGNLLFLCRYNIDHQHAYDEVIISLFEKLGIKSTKPIIENAVITPLTVSDKDIKSAIEELLNEKDENREFLFKNKKQWWAVFRVLNVFYNYPSKKTAFVKKMKELDAAKVDGERDLSYDSLSKASNDVPQIAICSPSVWDTYKDLNENYRQQYVVAEFLMQKLGIKS